ncbi:hypothetical protein A2U01_0051777, partial [Trifolium medium]|nr:hypothetical protein [Trifolium medium]
MKRKASKLRRRQNMGQAVSSVESDPIQNSAGKVMCEETTSDQGQRVSNNEVFGLEVVLSTDAGL